MWIKDPIQGHTFPHIKKQTSKFYISLSETSHFALEWI